MISRHLHWVNWMKQFLQARWLKNENASLRRQMLLLAGLIVLFSTVFSISLSYYRMSNLAHENGMRWVRSLAFMVANSSANAVVTSDLGALENVLTEIIQLPGIDGIEIVQPEGRLILALTLDEKGQSHSTFQSNLMRLVPQSSLVEEDQFKGKEFLRAWAPVGILGRSAPAWVSVRYKLEEQYAEARMLWLQSLVASLMVGMVSLFAFWVFVGRMLLPIGQLSRFAARLPRDTGASINLSWGSREAREMGAALNYASTQLAHQLAEIGANQAQSSAILNTAINAIFSVDQNGIVVSANPSVTSLFGREKDQVVGQTLQNMIPFLSAEKISEVIQNGIWMHSTGCYVARLELSGLRQDGTAFPLEVSIGEIPPEGRAKYALIVRDITEMKQAEESLNLFSRAMDCSHNAVAIIDIGREGKPMVYVNPAFEVITGYKPFEVLGRNWDLLHGEDIDQAEILVLAGAMQVGHEATVTLSNYRSDGSRFYNQFSVSPVKDNDGKVTHYVGILSDVTARVEAEKTILERSARLNAIFDLSPDGFVLFDKDGGLVFANPALKAMTGWSQGLQPGSVNLPQFDTRFERLCDKEQAYRPCLESNDDPSAREVLSLVQPERRVIERQVRHNVAGHGETIVYFRDITRETEVDRMKSEFLSTAAHELRTPLASIFGFTELMLNRKYPEQRQRDMLETMHKQAGLLVRMLNELLDLARIEARQGKDFHLVEQPLNAMIESSIRALMIKEGDRCVDVAPIPGINIVADAEKLQQALTNLLTNAYKYSPEGGNIALRTRVDERAGKMFAVIEVIDEGIGLKPEQLQRVFERFFRADPSGNIPGTGLGLSLVKEIVDLHDGVIEMDSIFGNGTTARMWIPASLPAMAEAAV